MRLIDADKFIEDLGLDEENAREDNLGGIVTLEDFDGQETAYDVEKVVQKITELQLKIKDKSLAVEDEEYAVMLRGQLRGIADCLEIVKSGGVADE